MASSLCNLLTDDYVLARVDRVIELSVLWEKSEAALKPMLGRRSEVALTI
jgi:hypothetical protein